MLNLTQRANRPEKQIEEAIYQAARMHHGCIPGVVASVDTVGGNVTVTPAINEPSILPDGTRTTAPLPDLPQVKLAVFGAGGFSITFPVSVGDEGLLLFQDVCLDSAWQNGGTNNPQLDKRRHDLSDAIFLPLTWTQPSQLENYSTSSCQIRSTDGQTVIDIADGKVTITAGTEVQVISPLTSVGANGSTPQTLVNDTFLAWFTSTVMPFLTGLGFTGTVPPGSATTNLKGA